MYEIPCLLFFGFTLEREESIDLVRRVVRLGHGDTHKYAREDFWDVLEYKHEVGVDEWFESELENSDLWDDLGINCNSQLFTELGKAFTVARLPLQMYFPEHSMEPDHNKPMDPQIYIAQGNHIELAANDIYYTSIELGKEREWMQQLEKKCVKLGIPYKEPSYEFIGPWDLFQRWNAFFIYGVKLEREDLKVVLGWKDPDVDFERSDIEDELIDIVNKEWEGHGDPLYLKAIDSGVGDPPNYFLGIRETFSGIWDFRSKAENLFLFDRQRLYTIQNELIDWNHILQTEFRKYKLNRLNSPHLYIILWTDSY